MLDEDDHSGRDKPHADKGEEVGIQVFWRTTFKDDLLRRRDSA